MRAPAFWWRRAPSPLSILLSPLGLLYGRIAGSRMRRSGWQAPIPVICIGNFTAGGAGKTPTALAVADLLRHLGEAPAFLTRGYGGRLAGPVRVDPAHHAAGDVGDEPLLLSASATTVVSRERPNGARLCAKAGASAIIMDDGLQNSSLIKDLTLAVVDGSTGIGNGSCLPGGPLRAPMAVQWSRTDAVVVIGPGEAGEAVARQAVRLGKPFFRAALKPPPEAASRLAGRKLLAFAGIGRPDKFFATLKECGAKVTMERPFPDHHPFQTHEIASLLDEADRSSLTPITTEKDWVRIRAASPELAEHILTLPVRLEFERAEDLRKFVERRLSGRRQGLNRSSGSGV